MTKLILMRNHNKPNEVIDPMDLIRINIGVQMEAMQKAMDRADLDAVCYHLTDLHKLKLKMIELRRSFKTNLN